MAVGGWSGGRSVTLCSSALEPAIDKICTVLERGQIGHEDPKIKNPDFPSQESARDKCNMVLDRGQVANEDPTIKNPDFSTQESGTSFMSPKGHILT